MEQKTRSTPCTLSFPSTLAKRIMVPDPYTRIEYLSPTWFFPLRKRTNQEKRCLHMCFVHADLIIHVPDIKTFSPEGNAFAITTIATPISLFCPWLSYSFFSVRSPFSLHIFKIGEVIYVVRLFSSGNGIMSFWTFLLVICCSNGLVFVVMYFFQYLFHKLSIVHSLPKPNVRPSDCMRHDRK